METRLKDDLIRLAVFFAACLVIFKLIFFREDIPVVFLVVGGFFYTFILPGFALMYYFNDSLDFLERLIIGIALGLALFGIVAYYTGLVGLSIRYQSLFLPGLFIILGSFLHYLKKAK